jgi:ComF family protein
MWGELLDLLAPPVCAVCGQMGHGVLCEECRGQFDLIAEPWCRQCGRALDPQAKGGPVCGECRAETFAFDWARAVGRHNGALRECVLAFKFRGATQLAGPLGELLAARLERLGEEPEVDLPPVQVVLPVPLHRNRRRWRGYDQALLLAREVAAEAGLRLARGALVREKETPPQVELTPAQRRDNVRGAFRVAQPWVAEGRHVLLVDDVMTTGATMNECAKVLRRAGASHVTALTVSRSSPEWDAGRDLY